MEKRGLITIIIILSILVVGMGGYTVYDKIVVTADKENKETLNKQDKKNEKVKKDSETSSDYNDKTINSSNENNPTNTECQCQTKPRCTGTYYGALSATETYKYVLKDDGTFSAEFGGGSGTTGVFVINDNTISFIRRKDTVGPRNQDPYFYTEDYLIADDCSSITVQKSSAIFGLDKQ